MSKSKRKREEIPCDVDDSGDEGRQKHKKDSKRKKHRKENRKERSERKRSREGRREKSRREVSPSSDDETRERRNKKKEKRKKDRKEQDSSLKHRKDRNKTQDASSTEEICDSNSEISEYFMNEENSERQNQFSRVETEERRILSSYFVDSDDDSVNAEKEESQKNVNNILDDLPEDLSWTEEDKPILAFCAKLLTSANTKKEKEQALDKVSRIKEWLIKQKRAAKIPTPEELAEFGITLDYLRKSRTKLPKTLIVPPSIALPTVFEAKECYEKTEKEEYEKFLHDQAIMDDLGKALTTADEFRAVGIEPRYGKFTKAEDARLMKTFEDYLQEKKLSKEEGVRLVIEYQKYNDAHDKVHRGFWFRLQRQCPDRSRFSVMFRMNKIYHPWGQKGKWSELEIALLIRKVAEHGRDFEAIAPYLQRYAMDCTNRYLYTMRKSKCVTGRWSLYELNELIHLVKQQTTDVGKDLFCDDIDWHEVSSKLVTRTSNDCRHKWINYVRAVVANKGHKQAFGPNDEAELLRRISNLGVHFESRISFNDIVEADEWGRQWTPGLLNTKWRHMRNRVENWRKKSLYDILTELIPELELARQQALEEHLCMYEAAYVAHDNQ